MSPQGSLTWTGVAEMWRGERERERERGQQRATEWGGDGTRKLGIWNSAEHCLELECEEEKTRLAVDRVKP